MLEVGPGLGVLTERLLDRCGFVHSVELDPRLGAMLTGEFEDRKNFHLVLADAVRFDYLSLEPPPVKFVANLPYSVAAPLVMTSLRLPSIESWCLMLQAEVAERLFAPVGSANYGGISVMVQLLAKKVSSRPVPATVFYPRPRVRSSLLAFRRREAAWSGSGRSAAGRTGEDAAAYRSGYTARHFDQVREIVYACFAQRRKKMLNSLADAEAGVLPEAIVREPLAARKKMLAAVLDAAGIPAGVRAQELAPEEFARLAEMLEDKKNFNKATNVP